MNELRLGNNWIVFIPAWLFFIYFLFWDKMVMAIGPRLALNAGICLVFVFTIVQGGSLMAKKVNYPQVLVYGLALPFVLLIVGLVLRTVFFILHRIIIFLT